MPALLIYLLKVNIALLLFCLGYYIVLRRLTFYTLNRVYLVFALAFSSVYPFVNISKLFNQPEKISRQLHVILINVNNYTVPVTAAKPLNQAINYWQWLLIAFWLGVVIMAIRLIVQLLSLYKIFRRSSVAMLYQQHVRIIDEHTTPFSFWQSIFINPGLHTNTELNSIIRHEQIHLKQWHTIDILFAEAALLAYWFNPAAWLIKRAINENLEFITDRAIIRQGADRKNYQYNLLHVNFAAPSNTIVNHFNVSTLKRRIIMMNSKKSSAFSLTSYTIVAPFIIALLLCFNFSEAALKTQKHLLKNFAAVVKAVSNQPIAEVAKPVNAPAATTIIATKRVINEAPVNPAAIIDTVKKQPVKTDEAPPKDIDDYIFYSDDQLLTKEQLKTFDTASGLVMIPLSFEETEKVFGVRKKAGVWITRKNKDTQSTKALIAKIELAQGTKIVLPGVVNGSIDPTLAKTPITVIGTDGVIYDNDASNKSPVTLNLAQFKNTGVLVVIDDRLQPQEKLANLNALSGENITAVAFLNKNDAMAKYGDKGSKGAVLITTTFFKNKPKN